MNAIPEKFVKEIEIFCKGRNIPIKDGKVSYLYQEKIENYLKIMIDRERNYTRILEDDINIKSKNIVFNLLNSLCGQIIFSPIEEYVWNAVVKSGLDKKAVRQYQIGKYKIDIAFPKKKLAVECDGQEYHKSNQDQLEKDQARDKYLAKKGWMTLRLSGIMIRRNIDFCIEQVKSFL